MMKKNRRSQKHLSQIVLAGMLSGLGVYANADSFGQFVLSDNELTIKAGSGTTFTEQQRTISSAGVVGKFNDVPSTNGVGIPSFEFTILENMNVADGTYVFSVGVVIDDKNSARQMEAIIGDLTLVVSGSNITGTIPAQNMQIRGRNGANTIQVTAQINNAGANGPVRISGGSVTFDAENLIERMRARFDSVTDIILDEFDDEADYEYSIVAVQTGGTDTIEFGTVAASVFTPFPTLATASDEFELEAPSVASLNGGYIVKGEFNVKYIAPSSGGGGETPTNTTIDDTTTAIDNVIANGGTPTPTQITALVTASQNLNTTLTNTNSATVTTTTLSTLGDAVKKLVATNSALATSGNGSTSVTSATTTVIANVATVIKDFSAKENLTTEEANAGLAVVKNLLDNAKEFFAGTDDDDTNLNSMNDLLNASFTLGANANPPETIDPANYTSAVEALDDLTQENSSCAMASEWESGTGLKASAAINPLQNDLWWVSPGTIPITASVIQFQPLSLAPGSLKPVYAWFTENLNFNANIFSASLQVGPCGTVTTVINRAVQAATGDVEVEKDLDNNTLRITLGAETYIGSIVNLSLLPSSFEDGNIPLADGTIVLAQEGLGYVIGSSAADFDAFEDAVEDAGLTVSARSDGSFDIPTGPNQNFSGVFAYDNVAGHEGACGVVTIGEPVGAVNSPGYAFTAHCETSGLTQRIVPYISQSAFYGLASTYGLSITTDRNSGIITVENTGSFKPSFFSNALTLNDQAFLNANAVDGFAFRTSDINGDGKIDFEILHSSGVQVLYGQ